MIGKSRERIQERRHHWTPGKAQHRMPAGITGGSASAQPGNCSSTNRPCQGQVATGCVQVNVEKSGQTESGSSQWRVRELQFGFLGAGKLLKVLEQER